MKKSLLIGLGASLLASTSAWAQPETTIQIPPAQLLPQLPLTGQTPPTIQLPLTQRYVLPTLPNIPAATALVAMAGKPDTFMLRRGRHDSKGLMETLAAKAGGKAIFADGFKTAPLNLYLDLQGTAPELMAQMIDLGIAAGKVGANWVFVPVQAKTTLRIPLYTQNLPRLTPRAVPRLRVLPAPKSDGFNIHPNPGQNLPPDAKPFEFNGDRWYFTPLGPKHVG